MKDYVSQNARMFDSWVEEGWEYGTPLNPEQCQRARQGYYSLYLTSTIPVPKAWLPQKLEEKKALGLAAGGGQQMAILSLLGARCTLIDISAAQLNADKALAEREGYAIRLVKGDISEPRYHYATSASSSRSSTNAPGSSNPAGFCSLASTSAPITLAATKSTSIPNCPMTRSPSPSNTMRMTDTNSPIPSASN